MANVIRIKRRTSGGSGAPSSLYDSELAYNQVDDTLYMGKGTGGAGGTASSILAIGGKGAFADLSSDQTVGGNKTFSNTIVGSINGNAGTATALQTARTFALTGDVTASGSFDGSANWSQAATIASNAITTAKINAAAVTNAKLAAMTNYTIKGRYTAGSGDPEDLTATQIRTILNVADGSMPGTVTSVAISLPTMFSVSGSPITGAGTLTASLANQNANIIFAGPSSGSAAAPTFRSLVAADLPSHTASLISDFNTAVRTNRLDQMAAPSAAVSLNGQLISNLADPVSAQDAATKYYVDSLSQGLVIKPAVRVATTANITLSGAQTIDGISAIAGDRVLVKAQTTASQNGLYLVASGSWTRTTDFDTSAKAALGSFVFVEEGSTLADTGWVLSNDGAITLGTTSLTFVQFSSAGIPLAGNGLSRTGNTFAVVGTTNRIVVSGSGVDIDSNYVGQSTITTLGTIGTGVWQGTAVGMAYGGTGVNLTSLSNNAMLKKTSGGVAAAVDGTDYLSPSATIDGGTF